MLTPMKYMALLSLIALWLAAPAAARIISVKPVDGVPGKVIAAPPEVLDGAIASSTHMVGFDERQNVLLTQDPQVDGGTITRGTRVNSHMILFNLPDDPDGFATPSEWFFGAQAENEWLFSGPVLGVMSDINGLLEAASTERLGARAPIHPAPLSCAALKKMTPMMALARSGCAYECLSGSLATGFVSSRVCYRWHAIRFKTAEHSSQKMRTTGDEFHDRADHTRNR